MVFTSHKLSDQLSVIYVNTLKALVVSLCLSCINKSSAQSSGNSFSVIHKKQTGAFPLVAGKRAAIIYYDNADAKVVEIAAKAFKDDVKLVTDVSPAAHASSAMQNYSVIVGTVRKSNLIDKLIKNKKVSVTGLRGKWETFNISVVDKPFANVTQALVIAGSDPRGTAFGLFELSRMIGVSPFYWWADVVPKHHDEIYISKGSYTAAPPSVKYRGIFLNDEDWGLQPWAAKTFEPETGDIGPKTYAKIFELLLRLRANLIWPAMHPSTKAFYSYPGNKQVAADYSIVIGSSHAEPMLRNNVGEWDEKTMGHFNYITNKQNVYKYWEDRVKESSGNEAMYTIGMRGVHDSGIEGVKTPKEAVPLVERIFEDQRDMLKKHVNKNVLEVPQAFIAYKEVLDIYDNNLKLPEDVTLVWPDDNYGYIQRLNNEEEKGRPGGAGVYYHASYWGRPHDYLWLSSTHPALIREEMMKAFVSKADRVWVLNVGDIKPLEYNIQLFLDMAYKAEPFKESSYVKRHMLDWISKIFGSTSAAQIQNVLWEYYRLAFERRPEFMGWSQTEPTTKTNYTDYNHFYYGDEAQRRIDAYEALEKRVNQLRKRIGPADADAFYELVYYPVIGASLMNKKFLYRDKSYLYARQNRQSAADYAKLSKQAYDNIVSETDFYNNTLANGKWKNMMSMKPRGLPVYQPAEFPDMAIDQSAIWNIIPEGYANKDSSIVPAASDNFALPQFNSWNKSKYFIDIFLNDNKNIDWTSTVSNEWIKLSQSCGTLRPDFGKKQMRIWVSMDWSKAPRNKLTNGIITFNGAGKKYSVYVVADNIQHDELKNYKGFAESNKYVSIYASNFSRQSNSGTGRWHIVDALGYTGKSLEARPGLSFGSKSLEGTKNVSSLGACAEYDFFTFTEAPGEVAIYTLPTHPLYNGLSMRYGVSIDNNPIQIIDFKTVGRSEEWKQNVLRNNAIGKVNLGQINRGKHTLKVYVIDPGVMLDRFIIDLGGFKKAYGVIEQTKYQPSY